MKATIFDDENLVVTNIIIVNDLSDVPGAGMFLGWHEIGKTYTITPSGVRVPDDSLPPPLEDLLTRQELLYLAALEHQNFRMNNNTKNEIDKSEIYLILKDLPFSTLPKAEADYMWLNSLWGEPTDAPNPSGSYYARANYLSETLDPDYDFSNFGNSPHTFLEIRKEREDYLAAL